MIQHRLGLNKSIRGGARTCRVVELSPNERKNFFSINHLDGDVGAIQAAGLVDKNDQLVAAASIRYPFHQKTYPNHIELARFATTNFVCVPGALSKLTQWAVKETKKLERSGIITYADGRIGLGNAYSLSGWSFVRHTEPRFWWTDNHVRYNRFKVRAGNGETEREKAERLGLRRIYGCRNSVFELPIIPTLAAP